MARKGLLKTVQFPDDLSNRFQGNVKDALEILAADHDVVSAPVLSLQVTGPIAPGTTFAAFRGPAGQTLTLPPASAPGTSTGVALWVENTSAAPVTVAAPPASTVDGGRTVVVPAGKVVAFTSDGVSKWLSGGIIAAGSVTLAMMANLPASTIVGNNTGAPATPLALTVAQVQALVPYAGRLRSFQVLTAGAAATYTRPAGITSILVEGQGGGGGGGGCVLAAAGQNTAGSGGGSGTYGRRWYLVAPATGTYTIGAAGTAGANTGAVAGNGGATTFTDGTTLLTLPGGAGSPTNILSTASSAGIGISLGGAGGAAATNADLTTRGEPGGNAMALGALVASSGRGGAGPVGGQGQERIASGTGQSALANSGAGGAGGIAVNGGAAVLGGAGGSGWLIVWEFA